MKKTNRLFSLFAAICVSATMLADVVYEPLVVDSGFNRDVIAETYYISDGSAYPSNCISYLRASGTYYTFGTREVIAAVNANKRTQRDLDTTIICGWPNDYHDTIWCTGNGDAYKDPLYKNVFWMLAPYNEPNVLTMRPDISAIGGTGTLKFKKVGCYSRLFFLLASAREGGSSSPREVHTIVRYTDNSRDTAKFSFAGLSGLAGHNVRKINIYEGNDYGYKKNCQDVAGDKNSAYAAVFDMEVDSTKLIHRIDFENKLSNTGVIILGVTGRTANIAAPKEETAQTKAIEENSFQACWAAVNDAVSYRLDVASDSAFQHILAAYNNKVIDEGTCAEVIDLVRDSAYYWRVRSVNAQGGQSASSAPRRVKTAGGATPATDETDTDIATDLESWLETTVSSIEIDRKLYRDGYYNTLCLPFNLSAAEIDASPLTGAHIYKYVRATKVSDAQLDIEVEDTTGITAGVPYLITWAPTSPEIIDNGILTFHNVYIRTNEGQTIGGADEVRFVGNIARAQMENGDHNNLFIGANNTLYWPNTDNKLRGFRAYFQVPIEGPAAVSPGAPARIVEHHQTTTEINIVVSPMSQNESVRKVLRDGQIYILRDGKVYSIMGQNVE